jgi:hypothetical protein
MEGKFGHSPNRSSKKGIAKFPLLAKEGWQAKPDGVVNINKER